MKPVTCLFVGIALFLAGAAHAQFSFSINLPAPPMWGPAGTPEVQYYYLPDVESFYDVRSSVFIYFDNGAWVRRSHLPSRYRDYDLYGGYKVVMHDYHGNNPYVHYKEYKSKYGKGYRGHPQKTYGERPGHGNPGGNNKQYNHPNPGGGNNQEKNDRNGHHDKKHDDHGNGGGKGNKK